MGNKLIYLTFLLIVVIPFQHCHNKSGSNQSTEFVFHSSNYYFKSVTSFSVEVYYEPGAEPYTGNAPNGQPYWQIVENNLSSIMQFRSVQPTISVPTNITSMKSLPRQNKSDWTAQDIKSLSSVNRTRTGDSQSAVFYIYFVKGYFNDGSARKTGVIGVNLGDTPIIAIFKEVIQGSGLNQSGPIPRFVEQSTLVHELGHALGFVNNGVPMASPHQDSAHGAHTTNSDCVMYWLNEGINDLSQFIQRYLTSSSYVMWGPEVLSDAQAFSE